MTASLAEEEELLKRKNFAKFKLNMAEGMAVDHTLTPRDFKVGVVLLQFMNRDTGDIFPSVETLAAITGLSERSVRYGLETLADAGWVSWDRGNRQKANQYAFEIDNLEPKLAERREILAGMKRAKKARPKAKSDRQPVAAQRRILSGNPLPLQTGNRLPPNTVMEHGSKKGRAL